MIRVLHIIGLMDRGGTENMIMNLYRTIDRTQVQFDFVEHIDRKAEFDDEILSLGGRIYNCPRYRGKNHFSYKKWWNEFFREHGAEYGLVHGHIGSSAAIYLKIAKKYGLYTVAHSHNTNSPLIYRAFAYPTRFIADHFFGCSMEAGLDRYGKKVVSDQTRFDVIKNAIDTSLFDFSPSDRVEVRRELGLEENFVVGIVGRFAEQKNPIETVEIFRLVSEQRSDARLLWVGDGELRPMIEEKIREYSLEDKVLLTGVRNDVPRMMQAMDVFIFPSLFEGFGMVAVEAQNAGLPTLCSDALPPATAVTDLIEYLPVTDRQRWADRVCSVDVSHRTGREVEIAAAGYDSAATARWFEKFYTEHSKIK